MPVLRSGTFILYGYTKIGGTWTDGATLTPPDSGWWYATNTGSVVTTFPATITFGGPTLLDTTTEGNALNPASPPTGFTPTFISSISGPDAEPGMLGTGASDLDPTSKVTMGGGSKSPPVPGSSGNFIIWNGGTDNYLELLDPLEITIHGEVGLTTFKIRGGPSTNAADGTQARITGGYDIVAYWWIIPDKDSCGNPQTSQLLLEPPGTDPGPPYELLDPLHPDTASPTVIVDALEPSSGLIAGGDAVTIRGSGFGTGATVKFDGIAATSVVVVSQYEITCVSPAHAVGTAAVVVRNLDGGHN